MGSCNARIRALARASGEVQWEYDIQRDGDQISFHGGILIDRDLVFVGTDLPTGHVYAFDLATGRVHWKHAAGTGVGSDILAAGDTVYALTQDGAMLALERRTGRARWSYSTGNPLSGAARFVAPALDEGRVFVPGEDGVIHALNANTGSSIWKSLLSSPVTTSLVVVGGEVFVGTKDGALHRMDARTGRVKGRLRLGRPPRGTLVPTGRSLLLFLGENQSDSSLVSLRRDLTIVDWEQPAPERSEWTSLLPLVTGNLVLAGGLQGELTAFRVDDGSLQWSAQVEGVVKVVGREGALLTVGTEGGILLSFRLSPP